MHVRHNHCITLTLTFYLPWCICFNISLTKWHEGRYFSITFIVLQLLQQCNHFHCDPALCCSLRRCKTPSSFIYHPVTILFENAVRIKCMRNYDAAYTATLTQSSPFIRKLSASASSSSRGKGLDKVASTQPGDNSIRQNVYSIFNPTE